MQTKWEIQMPQVTKCNVEDCAYNNERRCHARAITVGDADGSGHRCDTMMLSAEHCDRLEIAGVGACRATNCKHNRDFECETDVVNVEIARGRAECKTFAPG